jgi:peptide/nickel transport system substrate-binding protein
MASRRGSGTALCSLAAFCAALLAPGPAFARHDVLRYARPDEPVSLNPLYLDGSDFTMVSELVFEPLLRIGPGLKPVPGLAVEDPSTDNGGISADGTHITYRLRHDTRWSDGSPVTSDDVKFTLSALRNPRNDVTIRGFFGEIAGVRTPDRWTVVIDLKHPDPATLAVTRLLVPLPAHLLRGYADLNRVPFDALPVGNGPYRVVAWRRGDVIALAANPRYWRGPPAVPRFEIRIVPSSGTALLQLRTGEADLADVPASQVANLPASGLVRSVAASLGWMQLTFNLDNPALADRDVRRALTLAVDRDTLAREVGHGLFQTGRVLLPMFQWALDPAAAPPRFDPAEAARLLDRRGWKIGSDGLRHKGSRTLSFTMIFAAGGNGVLPAGVAADLARVNVHVDEKAVQDGLLYDTAAAGGILKGGKFDLALIGLQTNPDPDLGWLIACDQRSPNGYNYAHYCNPRVDADLARARSTFDRAARIRALSEVQRRLLVDLPFDPLFRVDDMWANAPWIRGIAPSPYDPFWNVYAWTAAP